MNAINNQALTELISSISAVTIPEKRGTEELPPRKASDLPFIAEPIITKKTKTARFTDFVAIDVETTGLSPDTEKIIELSAVKFRGLKPVEIWTSLINPRRHIPSKVVKINGIDDAAVQDAPMIEDVKDSFEKFLSGTKLIVGHNMTFDLKFLWTNNIDIPDELKKLDTMKMAHIAYDLGNYKLPTVAEHLGITYDAHRSYADSMVAGLVFAETLERFIVRKNERRIERLNAIQEKYGKPSEPVE